MRTGRAAPRFGQLIETPLAAHLGNYQQIRIVPQARQKGRGRIATIHRQHQERWGDALPVAHQLHNLVVRHLDSIAQATDPLHTYG